jgi:HEAT repeat protein
MPPTVVEIARVRSQLADEVTAYLSALIRRTAELPAYFPRHLRIYQGETAGFDRIRQLVRVVDRGELERHREAGQERGRRYYADDQRGADGPRDLRQHSGRDGSLYRPSVSWDEYAGHRFGRAVILGDPGAGKSWLLQWEARRLARDAAHHVTERSAGLEDVILPIWLRPPDLKDLNGTGGRLLDNISDRVARFNSERVLSSHFQQLLRNKLVNGSCVLLLDGWNDVQHDRLRPRLEDFSREYSNLRLLVSSRGASYGISPVIGAQELELVEWEKDEIESFVRVWLDTQGAEADRLCEKLHEPEVRGLTKVPHMVALICSAYLQGALRFPIHRGRLYEACLEGLLLNWKPEEGKPLSRQKVYALLELLAPLSLELFRSAFEQFDDKVIRRIAKPYLEELKPSSDLRNWSVDQLVDTLAEAGILVRSGHAAENIEFLHPTFHEYLAARALADNGDKHGRFLDRIVRQRKVFGLVNTRAQDPRWHEVITLLAGILEDPKPLLKVLLRRDDLFRHRLGLAMQCLGELANRQQERCQELIDDITTEAWKFYCRHQERGTTAAVEHISRSFAALASLNSKVNGIPLLNILDADLRDENPRNRLMALRMLGKCGAAAAPLVDQLADVLRDEDREVQAAVFETMAKLGSIAATPMIINELARLLTVEYVDSSAAIALGHLGRTAAKPEFLTYLAGLLYDEDSNVQRAAAEAVEYLGQSAATPEIETALGDLLRYGEWFVQSAAARAAGALGAKVPAELQNLLNGLVLKAPGDPDWCDRDWLVQGAAAHAIGKLSLLKGGVFTALAELACAGNHSTSIAAAYLLRTLEGAAAGQVLPILEGLVVSDGHLHMRIAAFYAIGRISARLRNTVLNQLAALLSAEDVSARLEATRTVGQLGRATPEILRELVTRLADDERDVRKAAAAAVGRLGHRAATAEILAGLSSLLLEPDLFAGVAILLEPPAPLQNISLVAAEAIVKVAGGNAAREKQAIRAISDRLTDLLNDWDLYVGLLAAAWALNKFEGGIRPEILERSAALLRIEKHPEVRDVTMRMLAKLGDKALTPEVLAELHNMLNDGNQSVREAAAEAARILMSDGIRFRLKRGHLVKQNL